MHIGRLIKNRIAEKNMTIVAFAEQLHCTRVNVYKIFNKNSIDTDMLVRISLILEYDFFQHYSNAVHERAKCI